MTAVSAFQAGEVADFPEPPNEADYYAIRDKLIEFPNQSARIELLDGQVLSFEDWIGDLIIKNKKANTGLFME